MFRLCFCIYWITLVIIPFFPVAQTSKISILKNKVYNSKSSDEKLKAIFALCDERHSLSTDSLQKYASEALRLSHSRGNKIEIAYAEYYDANYLLKIGLIDSAFNICNRNIKMLKTISQGKDLLHEYEGCRAGIFIKKNLYKEALSEFYRILNEAEINNDTPHQISGKNGIGWVNLEIDRYRESLDWLNNALHTSGNEKYESYLVYIYSNIAANYNSLSINDSAEIYINKSLLLARKVQNLSALANGLNIQADIYTQTKRISLAEKSLTEALGIRKLVGDPFYVVSDMMQLAKFYGQTGQPAKGIDVSLEGIKMAKSFNLSSKLLILYDALAQNYKAAHDYGKYATTLERIISVKDSVYNKNSAEALADVQARYALQKKENIIIQQKLDLVSKNYLLYGTLITILFIIITASIIFKNFRRRQQLKLELMMQEEKRSSFMAVRQAEETERKRIAADLHDNMGAYATAMIANVEDLAKQETKNVSTLEHLKSNASEIMSHLRDTIWALNKESIFVTAISDRFKNYVQKIGPAYPAIKIEISEDILSDVSLSPVQALNIFRILQEALTNALKHSHANHIGILISSNNRISMSVADNGIGINEKNLKMGNGLTNMETRALEAGFALDIPREKGGTRILLYT